MTLPKDLRHSHSGLGGDGDRIKYKDLVGVPELGNSAVGKYCQATKGGSQTIPASNWTKVAVDSYVTNDSNMSATSTVITIPTAGRYIITAIAFWNTGSTAGQYTEARLLVGTTVIGRVSDGENSASQNTNSLSYIGSFSGGNQISLEVFHNKAGTHTVGGNNLTYLHVGQIK